MRAIGLALLAFCLTGCDCKPSQPRQNSATPGAATAPAPAALGTTPAVQPASVSAASIPIVYVDPEGTERLSVKAVERMLRSTAAQRMAQEGRPPWFIAVHHYRPDFYHQSHRLMLYYPPDRSTDRVRLGRFLLFWWYTGDTSMRRQYVQVSRPDHPFTSRLETPAIGDLPWEFEHYPEDPPAPEPVRWAEFMDFARPLLEEGLLPENRMPPYLIGRKRHDTYVIANGTDNGGDSVIARPTAQGFRLNHHGWWSGHPWGCFE